ncbi:MAG: DUF5678 domain-containing protein [Thermodesulfobacteriota bacterium]|nr:DUF5678 domain-containing protein [Thermodesulfobacteriota bacterium]
MCPDQRDRRNIDFVVALFRKREIMEKSLVSSEEYNGRYVAVKSFDDNTIVGVGDDPERALNDAERKGFKNPVLLSVPERDVVRIY